MTCHGPRVIVEALILVAKLGSRIQIINSEIGRRSVTFGIAHSRAFDKVLELEMRLVERESLALCCFDFVVVTSSQIFLALTSRFFHSSQALLLLLHFSANESFLFLAHSNVHFLLETFLSFRGFYLHDFNLRALKFFESFPSVSEIHFESFLRGKSRRVRVFFLKAVSIVETFFLKSVRVVDRVNSCANDSARRHCQKEAALVNLLNRFCSRVFTVKLDDSLFKRFSSFVNHDNSSFYFAEARERIKETLV